MEKPSMEEPSTTLCLHHLLLRPSGRRLSITRTATQLHHSERLIKVSRQGCPICTFCDKLSHWTQWDRNLEIKTTLATRLGRITQCHQNKDLRSLFGQVCLDASALAHKLLRPGQHWPLIKSILRQTHSIYLKFQLMYQRIGDTPTL